MHFQKPGDFRHRLLVVMDELAGVRDLLGRQGRGGAEPHTPRLRRDPAGARALHDQAGAPWESLQYYPLRDFWCDGKQMISA